MSLTLCRWKLPHEEVVYENERVRRRAKWKDGDDHDDEDDGEGDVVESDEEDQNSDVEENEKTMNEKAEVMLYSLKNSLFF